MPDSSNFTEGLIARAKRGEAVALVTLIGRIEPRLRGAVNAELDAVQHDLDATQTWNEIQDEAKRRVSEFAGTTDAEFAAWAERLALRHIRYSLAGRAGNIQSIVDALDTDMLAQPPQTSEVSKTSDVSSSLDANADPNATIAPTDTVLERTQAREVFNPDVSNTQKTKSDPNATLAPGDGDTIGLDAFVGSTQDPHATITDLAAIPLAPQTTKIFGDYEILETIAKGGMGVVYKARQRSLNRIVALKMILAGQFADQEDIDRFHVEAQAAAQLRNPNIVGIYEVGECEGQHYFSMEYIEGRSLGDLVREHPLAPRAAARFVKTVSEAMYYAHQSGVLHRDLKPSNVLVDDNDVPLITDFGLAKRTEEQSQRTAAGSVLGTPSYMPPEQATGKLDQISERSDVYSIGAILYELITGKPPFGAANPWETIKQVISNEPVSPRLLNNSVPVDLETICLKCLQKDQDRRYDTAQELADELQRFLTGQPIQARPIGVIERSVRWCCRNPWPTAALGVLLFAVVGISAGFYKARIAQGKAVIAKEQAETSRNVLLQAINDLFTAWGDVKLLNEPGSEDVRTELLATARDLYKTMGEELGKDPKIQHELGVSYFRFGRMMFHLRSNEEALVAINSGLNIQQPDAKVLPDGEVQLQALGETLNLKGNVVEIMALGENGTSNRAQDELRDAEGVYDQAIAARTKLVKLFPDKPKYRRQLLNSQMNQGMIPSRMGSLFDDQDRAEEAKKSYVEARLRVEAVQRQRREMLAQLDEESELYFDVIHDLAQGYYNLAKVTWRLRDYQATESNVMAAVAEFTTLLAENPETLEYQYDQASCWVLVGEAKFEQMFDAEPSATRTRLSVEALGAYGSAEKTLKRLASESTSVPKYRRDLARVYSQIGAIHFDAEQDQKALDAFQSAEKIFYQLVTDFPSDEDRRALAQVYLQIGGIHFLFEQDEKALDAYHSAEKILAPMVTKFSDDEDSRALARVYSQTGKIHFLDKQYPEALDAYRAAETLLTPMVANSPDDEDLRDMLAQASSGIAKATSEAAKVLSATEPE